MNERYHLYFDDTGSRDPDKTAHSIARRDGMDCFGLGGIMIAEEHVKPLLNDYYEFCEKHGITYPLHSWAIRGGREKFGWLKNPDKAHIFLSELDTFITSLPIVTVACVVHRPGYVARYSEEYRERLWLMCRTACSILVERAAKFARDKGRRLEIYFEESGVKEDRDIERYIKELKNEGLPFSDDRSDGYNPLSAGDFQSILWGKPKRKTKKTPMIQIADLVLYPMAKAGYQADYLAYRNLSEAGKLIECHLAPEEMAERGTKYSCFERRKD
jgi:Protein of unknown function (DUF3800)